MIIASALLALMGGHAGALSQAPHQQSVGLVVQFGAGQVYQECIAYQPADDGLMTGLEVLQASAYGTTLEIDASFGGLGGAVCKIGATGCVLSAGACFCQPSYWSYYRRGNAGWQVAAVGAGSAIVQPGAVEGWSWGRGGVAGAPEKRAFAQICGASRVWLPLIGRMDG